MPELIVEHESRDEDTRLTLKTIKRENVTGFELEKSVLGEHPIQYPTEIMRLTYYQLLDLKSLIDVMVDDSDIQGFFNEN